MSSIRRGIAGSSSSLVRFNFDFIQLQQQVFHKEKVKSPKLITSDTNTVASRPLNTPSRARSGLVRSGQVHILDTCLCCITCFRNQTLINSVIGLIIVYSPHLRSFSTLRRTKTWLRCTQGQERLSSLASMQVEREILSEIKIQDIVSKFAAKAERRLQLH